MSSDQRERRQIGLLSGDHLLADGDLAFTSDQRPRAPWQPLIQSLDRLEPEAWAGRREAARRTLRDFNLTRDGDPAREAGNGVELDLIPLLLAPETWNLLEQGIQQRARLLSALLEDFYGAGRLVREGRVPPSLLYANPDFLRACAGGQMSPANRLFFLACDLALTRQGRWLVVADHCRGPRGAGIALQNRIALSRVHPQEFHCYHVRRLAGFFQSKRESLRGLSRRRDVPPSVVLLSTGSAAADWAEHVFLSRYLGIPLVEGDDLTVRDRRVFLKTLEGLHGVDVILRYLEGALCDPLELPGTAVLGLPGLFEAMRAGNVVVANLPGAGVLETPGLFPFLPRLCRHLLGEDLLLPGPATWWCGLPRDLEETLRRRKELIIRPAFMADRAGSMGGEGELTIGALKNTPHRFLSQERLELATAPTLAGERIEPRPFLLRAFISAQGDGWQVMPGGFVQVLAAGGAGANLPRPIGLTKDAWVLATEPVEMPTLLSLSGQAIRLETTASEVPSRVADNLFWLGRYAERLEDTARILRCVLARSLDESDVGRDSTGLAHLMVGLDLLPAQFRERFPLPALQRELLRLSFQLHRLGTIKEVLGRLWRIAFSLRDRFSNDTWRILNRLNSIGQTDLGQVPAVQALAYLNEVILHSAAFSGMEMENMTRGYGWRFLDLGRRLERAANVITLLEAGLAVASPEDAILEPILEISESLMTYRRRYFAQPKWSGALDLLLADETNPRSLAFQLQTLAGHAPLLPAQTVGATKTPETELIERTWEDLEQADWGLLAQSHFAGQDTDLKDLLVHLRTSLQQASNLVARRYFSHATSRISQ